MKVIITDGGRAEAGFRGDAGDCVTRAIAIVTGLPYMEVYEGLKAFAEKEKPRNGRKRSSIRNGVRKPTIKRYLAHLGYTWTPTMHIGSGCTVHLHDGELPDGRLIVSVSKHLTAVIDGVIYDTFDPQRERHVAGCKDGVYYAHASRRCVYGYWMKG